jgi:Big-like domain-containing protein
MSAGNIEIIPIYEKRTTQGPFKNPIGARNIARSETTAGITDANREYNAQQSSSQLSTVGAQAASKDVDNIRDVMLRYENIMATKTGDNITGLGEANFTAQTVEDKLYPEIELDTPPPPVDTTLPTILSKTPDNGATAVSITTNILVVFSEPMDPLRVTSAELDLWKTADGASTGDVPIAVALNVDTATIDPVASLLEGTQYTVRVRGGGAPSVADLAGNAMADPDITWSFTTIPAPPPPITYTKKYDLSAQGTSWTTLDHNDYKSSGCRLDSNSTTGSITGNPPLFGQKPRGADILMHRVGSPGGTVSLKIMHDAGSGNPLTNIYTLATMNANDITTNTAGVWYQFRHPNTQTIAMAVGDCIVVETSAGDSSKHIKVRRSDSDIWDKGVLIRGTDDDADQDSGRDWPHIIYI